MKFTLATLFVAGAVCVGIGSTLYPWRSIPARETAIIRQVTTQLPGKLASINKALDVHALIRAAAQKHGVSEAFLKSIVAAESNFNCDAVSRTGAIGLMQLMPATAQEYGADPKVPEQNIEAGARYLRTLMTRYKKKRDPLTHVIAAYNAGPGAVDRYRGVPPFRETRRYVVRVRAFMKRFKSELAGSLT